MKALVTVLGMSDRVAGNNKSTGKPFDFRRVAFGFVNQYGSNDVAVVSVNTPEIEAYGITPGIQCTAIINQVKSTYYIDVIDGPLPY